MRFRIKTWVFCGFGALIVLLSSVSIVAVNRTDRIASLAREVNSKVLDKTRIAADIISLTQQIRFVDAFVLRVQGAHEADLVARDIEDRTHLLDQQVSSYRHYIDSTLERTLFQNLEKSLSAYLTTERDVLNSWTRSDERDVLSAEDRLTTAFEQVRRQVKGLSVVAATEARSTREEANRVTEAAHSLVLAITAIAFAIGVLIAALLSFAIFRPLARVTKALLALADGDLDVSLPSSNGSGEIAEVVRALDTFRRNAVALSTAHAEARAAHERADTLARHDALTGLPNRRALSCAIEETIERNERRGLTCAVLLLDLDRFKPVNDIYGHGAGDRVLCEVAGRLKASVRAYETVARLGGDEFAVVIEYESDTDTLHRVAKRLAEAVAEPIAIDGRTVSVGTSIGIAVWPSDGMSAEALLHAADLAMFQSKRDARGSFRFYEAEMDVQVRERADLENRVQTAIETGDIRPHFQPLVDLSKNALTGFEVLARWYDGDRIRPPSDFIFIAEEAGLISELTYSVLRQACRSYRSWPEELTLAINITPAQILDHGLPETLLRILDEEQFAPTRLELEITENALIGDVSAAKEVIEGLRSLGIKVSLDDFGTGYSSLHHLRDLKFDKIKIDRSFVQTMLSNPESAKIVETVLGLGRSLGMLTVAEGIEDEDHLRSLIQHGCQFGQGYHLGKPLSTSEIVDFLASSGSPQPKSQAA